jgi:hypothetical protein
MQEEIHDLNNSTPVIKNSKYSRNELLGLHIFTGTFSQVLKLEITPILHNDSSTRQNTS